MSKEAEPIHKKTDEQIVVELEQNRAQLYTLKAQAVTEKLEDPSQMTKSRKTIARLLTEQQARKIEAQKAEA